MILSSILVTELNLIHKAVLLPDVHLGPTYKKLVDIKIQGMKLKVCKLVILRF